MRQMLEAQNEMRRRRGVPEMTEDDLDAAVREDERVRTRGRGPFESACPRRVPTPEGAAQVRARNGSAG